jgi:hypothetical protein
MSAGGRLSSRRSSASHRRRACLFAGLKAEVKSGCSQKRSSMVREETNHNVVSLSIRRGRQRFLFVGFFSVFTTSYRPGKPRVALNMKKAALSMLLKMRLKTPWKQNLVLAASGSGQQTSVYLSSPTRRYSRTSAPIRWREGKTSPDFLRRRFHG